MAQNPGCDIKMNFLELYAKLKMQTSLMQFTIMLAMVYLNSNSNHWFTLIPMSTILLYFIISLIGYELTIKDVEIDQVVTTDRTDSQKRLQFVKIALDWFLMILAILSVLLTSISLVLDYVSISFP